MGLYGMMITSASGMAAQANLLSAVSDNIANADTTGYKRATAEFSTLVLQSATSEYNSGAVETEIRRHNSTQGALNYTSSPTDLAIQGEGFFVVSAPDGSISLTRAGSFAKDGNGDLVNAAGMKILAYPATEGTNPVSNGFAGLVPVNVGALGPIAQPSTVGSLAVNLPPESQVVPAANLPSANAATAQFTKMTSLVAYDDVGVSKTLDIYETKTAANTWQIAAFDRADAAVGGGFPYASAPLATTTLTFNPTTGSLATMPQTIVIPVPGGRDLTIDLSQSTELAGGYVINAANVNGSAPSTVDHVEIDESGGVSAVYKNGSRTLVFQIPLATVPSPDNLELREGNTYAPTLASGTVRVGLPQTNTFGSIMSSALEKSTVDVATELTNMIASQHSYTANSKVFQTAADLMEVLINLKR